MPKSNADECSRCECDSDSKPSCECPREPSAKSDEVETLKAMEKFRKFYEDKLKQIDIEGGGDCTELKLKLQERWIRDLTEQTEMMAKIVKELEEEATTRVRMLEEKLKQSSKAAYETKKENDEKKSEEVERLVKKLKEAEAKIRRMRPCVDMKSACTATDDKLASKEKDNEEEKKEKEKDMERERALENEICCRTREVECLKERCEELQKALDSSQARGENLQKAASNCSARAEVKKLRHQKRCYEHMLECFKQEMTVMSEQLINLQEILKISSDKCKEENCQLCCAITELQQTCEKLKLDLKDAEKKSLVESKMLEVKDAKIDELQLIIGQKNTDLNVHDAAIRELKVNLENAVIRNHELQATIASLNSTIMSLKCQCEQPPKTKTNVTESESVGKLQTELEKKEKKLNKIHKDYVAQHEILKSLEAEFDTIKEKNREKIKTLKRQNEVLKEKLGTTEKNNQKMVEELAALKEQICSLGRTDAEREHELIQSKQTINELRQTLIELNESLAESELQQLAIAGEMQKKIKEDRKQEDVFKSCQCEIALYKKLVQNLNDAFLKMQKNLTCLEVQNKSLIEELKHKDAKMEELQKKLVKKEKETCHNVRELTEKLKKSHEEERRLNHFIEKLKNEVQEKLKENANKMKCYCENVSKDDMRTTQEEINELKVEIKQMIHNQLALNNENANLIQQVSQLRSSFDNIDEKNRNLKQKNEKLQDENKKLKENSKILQREKEMFIQTIRNLEAELAEARSNRDDICAESRNVVNNVKAWLEEQKKINDKVKKNTQCYCDTITQLKEKNEKLQNLAAPVKEVKKKIQFRTYSPPPPETNDCPSPWCYDSQGNDTPRDSPSSFTCSVEEWYSPNYRDETDFDSDHDDNNFVTTLEAVAVEMKNNNKKWKDKCKECECMTVSKDDT